MRVIKTGDFVFMISPLPHLFIGRTCAARLPASSTSSSCSSSSSDCLHGQSPSFSRGTSAGESTGSGWCLLPAISKKEGSKWRGVIAREALTPGSRPRGRRQRAVHLELSSFSRKARENTARSDAITQGGLNWAEWPCLYRLADA